MPTASDGMILKNIAQIFVDLGCKTSYNLDAGGSAEMYFNGRAANNANDGKGKHATSDILLHIKY